MTVWHIIFSIFKVRSLKKYIADPSLLVQTVVKLVISSVKQSNQYLDVSQTIYLFAVILIFLGAVTCDFKL